MKVLDMKIPKRTAVLTVETVFPTTLIEHTVRKFIGQGKSTAHLIASAFKSKFGTKEKKNHMFQGEKLFVEDKDLTSIVDAWAKDRPTTVNVLDRIMKKDQTSQGERFFFEGMDRNRLYAMANDSTTSANLLDYISTSSVVSILVSVAGNENISKKTLQQLANHHKPEVRAAVIENRNTSFKVLSGLCNDEHPDVRFAMAENSNVPKSLLEKLTGDDNPYVAFRAQATLERLQMTLIS